MTWRAAEFFRMTSGDVLSSGPGQWLLTLVAHEHPLGSFYKVLMPGYTPENFDLIILLGGGLVVPISFSGIITCASI